MPRFHDAGWGLLTVSVRSCRVMRRRACKVVQRHAEIREWQSRPLDDVYAIIYFDAVRAKVRHDGLVRSEAAAR